MFSGLYGILPGDKVDIMSSDTSCGMTWVTAIVFSSSSGAARCLRTVAATCLWMALKLSLHIDMAAASQMMIVEKNMRCRLSEDSLRIMSTSSSNCDCRLTNCTLESSNDANADSNASDGICLYNMQQSMPAACKLRHLIFVSVSVIDATIAKPGCNIAAATAVMNPDELSKVLIIVGLPCNALPIARFVSLLASKHLNRWLSR